MAEPKQAPAYRRVRKNHEALYGVGTARKRRRCEGLTDQVHWIEPGQQFVASALPPDSWVGNKGWWHSFLCMECCPVEYVKEQTDG